MRSFVVAIAACLAVAVLASEPAAAARKKRKASPAPLTVVVLPFVGKATGGLDAKEALELELELVDNVRTADSSLLEQDLRKVGRKAWDKDALAGILKRREVDVVLRGERGPGERSPDALLVTAWARDGQPRFFKELALGTSPDAAAAAIVAGLRPALEGWRGLRPIRLPSTGEKNVDGDSNRLRAEDVLMDEDEDAGEKKRTASGAGSGERRILADSDGSEAGDDEKRGKQKTETRTPLDFNDPAPPAEDDEPKSRRRRLDDDEPEDRLARAGRDDSGGRRGLGDDDDRDSRPDMGSIDDEVSEDEERKNGHKLLLSGAFEGGTWFWSFDGGGLGDQQLSAPFYPGGGVTVDVWPLSGLPWFGVDGDIALSAVPFQIQGGALRITPGEFVAMQMRAGAAAKARYAFSNGLGVGVRAGYRYFGANVETQTIQVGGQAQTLTVVPGFTLHGVSAGMEIFFPLLVAQRRLEIELRADALPATYYAEAPDNPGSTSLGVGWSAFLGVRFEVASGFFVEARGQSVGASVDFQNAGQRVAFVGDKLQQLQGGTVLNATAGFALGVGYMW